MGRPGNQVGAQDSNQGWSLRRPEVQGSFVVIDDVRHYEQMPQCDKVPGLRVSGNSKLLTATKEIRHGSVKAEKVEPLERTLNMLNLRIQRERLFSTNSPQVIIFPLEVPTHGSSCIDAC